MTPAPGPLRPWMTWGRAARGLCDRASDAFHASCSARRPRRVVSRDADAWPGPPSTPGEGTKHGARGRGVRATSITPRRESGLHVWQQQQQQQQRSEVTPHERRPKGLETRAQQRKGGPRGRAAAATLVPRMYDGSSLSGPRSGLASYAPRAGLLEAPLPRPPPPPPSSKDEPAVPVPAPEKRPPPKRGGDRDPGRLGADSGAGLLGAGRPPLPSPLPSPLPLPSPAAFVVVVGGGGGGGGSEGPPIEGSSTTPRASSISTISPFSRQVDTSMPRDAASCLSRFTPRDASSDSSSSASPPSPEWSLSASVSGDGAALRRSWPACC